VLEIVKQPKAVFVFWSKRLNWQLRADVEVSVMSDLTLLNTLWESVKDGPSAMDYLGAKPPGTPLKSVMGGQESAIEHHRFNVLIAVVKKIDWLELSRGGHRRALITADAFEWLAP
jgi:hypothetical protein